MSYGTGSIHTSSFESAALDPSLVSAISVVKFGGEFGVCDAGVIVSYSPGLRLKVCSRWWSGDACRRTILWAHFFCWFVEWVGGW
jgi:hypothetical protein